MISIKNVSKSYIMGSKTATSKKATSKKATSKKATSKNALDNINLEINRGEIIGVFGENGAGKTTLMKSILNLHKFNGEITLDGEKISNNNITKLSFATCEHSFFTEISANEHREFYQSHFENFKSSRFDSLIKFFELPLNKNIKSFSTGQKNQFEVILALSQGADFIFMDEPFASNDIFNREDFYKVLLGILDDNETIILSTHLIEEVEKFISRAVLLSKGSIIAECDMSDLEDEGKSLVSYVKEVYNYQNDRVSLALDELTGDGSGGKTDEIE